DGAWRSPCPVRFSSRLDVLGGALVRRGRSSSATRRLTALASRDSRFFARELVRGSFLVSGASALCRDRALRLRIHRREPAWCLATDTSRVSRFHSAVRSPSRERSAVTLDVAYAPCHDATVSGHCAGGTCFHSCCAAATSAPLVHSVSPVISIVCHYRSPAAISSLVAAAA